MWMILNCTLRWWHSVKWINSPPHHHHLLVEHRALYPQATCIYTYYFAILVITVITPKKNLNLLNLHYVCVVQRRFSACCATGPVMIRRASPGGGGGASAVTTSQSLIGMKRATQSWQSRAGPRAPAPITPPPPPPHGHLIQGDSCGEETELRLARFSIFWQEHVLPKAALVTLIQKAVGRAERERERERGREGEREREREREREDICLQGDLYSQNEWGRFF